MSEVFETYERQYCEASASLARKCTAAAAHQGEKLKQKASEIKSGIDGAEALIKKMDLEARNLQPSVRAGLLAKLREYKSDLNNLKGALKRISSGNAQQGLREELLESGMADTLGVSADQRSRLLRATETQNQTTDRLRDSHRTMLETEDLGVSILQDLHQQRQSLLHAHDTAKMFYYNSSALLEPSTQSSLLKAIDISKKFGSVTFFDLNLPLPLWSSSKETKSLIKEAWEAANIIEVTKQELKFLCDIKPSEEFDTNDNDKSKFKHYSPDMIMKLWHENLKVLFVTNGTSKIHYYTEKDNGWVRGTEDAPITPFTSDMSQSGDAIVAALMRMLAVNPHLVTDKVYLHKAVKHAIKCGVIDQWVLARERGFLPKEREDPTSEQYELRRSITEREYRTLPDAMQSENSSTGVLFYVE